MATVDFQFASQCQSIPTEAKMRKWIDAAPVEDKVICLRVVDRPEIQTLNLRYRHQDKATNVLSFPLELPEGVDEPLLGDIVACAEVIEEEALQANKDLDAHWAHILIHGTLHLLGYDHIDDAEAEIMEGLETKFLGNLGFPDPYATEPHR